MADTNPYPSFPDVEGHFSYAPLPDESQSQRTGASSSKPFKASLIILFGILLLGSFVVFVSDRGSKVPADKPLISSSSSSSISPETKRPLSKGVSEGVSEKWFRRFSGNGIPFPWNHSELSWQRTAYHLQTQTNYISDPDGPIFYKGWYHLFYQYNPYLAKWGNITWGHSVSRDLIHWLYLPVAMAPDQWYDINGVFSGSASILPDGRIVMLYTGATNESVQVQNLAYPANLSDPLLVEWVKYPGNPVLVPPPGIGIKDFRDPSTAWNDSDGAWQITIGSRANSTGISLMYRTNDFINYELLDGLLHAVNGTGMWECMDLYPVAINSDNGLEMSATGPGVKHVLKASLDDTKIDYYSIGSYDRRTKTWTPDNPDVDVGIGLRYDWGPRYYASRSFYDQKKRRRVLWGWIGETDSEEADLEKGWASVETIPRTVLLDQKTRTNILQWPVEEVESLRLSSTEFSKVKVGPGSVVPLKLNTASQLDIVAEFEIDKGALEVEADAGYHCNTSEGAAGRGVLGPFGLLVIATENLSEETPVYFYIAKGSDGNLKTFFCADNLRSSKAGDLYSKIYGSTVPVLEGEKLQMRLLVDHSIVESFAQGGRTLITWRVYPTEAIYEAARVFLFNNATGASITASVKVWEMNSAFLHPFRAE